MNDIAIINDDFGVIEKKGKPVVTSLKVAEIFGKRHDNVIRDIEELISNLLKSEETSEENFRFRNFAESYYKDSKGRKQKMYEITRDGFTLLSMGFTGEKALQFKIAYINRFNQMEEFIENITMAKVEFPEFTEAIQLAHEEPKPYHFSNEIDMINRIVLGTSAKKFKEINNIPEDAASIRPYLTTFQVEAIRILQRMDIGLIEAGLGFDARKDKLIKKYNSFRLKLIAN